MKLMASAITLSLALACPRLFAQSLKGTLAKIHRLRGSKEGRLYDLLFQGFRQSRAKRFPPGILVDEGGALVRRLAATGEHGRAARLFVLVLQARRKWYGKGVHKHAGSFRFLADLYEKDGDERAMVRTLCRFARASCYSGMLSAERSRFMGRVISHYVKQHRLDRALDAWRLKIAYARRATDKYLIPSGLSELGQCYIDLAHFQSRHGKSTAARVTILRALQALRKRSKASYFHTAMAATLKGAAAFYRATGDSSRAKRAECQAAVYEQKVYVRSLHNTQIEVLARMMIAGRAGKPKLARRLKHQLDKILLGPEFKPKDCPPSKKRPSSSK